MTGRLIGLTGLAGCGKTTARQFLQENGWQHVKMAGVLKDMCRVFFDAAGLDSDRCIEGDLKETCLDELMGVSPRHVMQTIGTEWGRGCVHESIWVVLAEKRAADLMGMGHDVIFDDIRFDNEADMIHSLGGKVVAISGRGGISGSHESENGVHPDFTIENKSTIERFKNDVLYILHRKDCSE